MNKLIVPTTGLKLVDGSIVILDQYPGIKWIVHNGWYFYNNQQSMGWYFCSIPDKKTLPATTEYLETAIAVSDEGSCPCPPHPHPRPGPCPPGPHTENFTEDLRKELDAAFISVDTIADRNSLLDHDRKLPNGKLVRVNYIDDNQGPKYYRWDANNLVWKEETFGVDTSKYVTKDELSSEVDSAITNADIPGQIDAALKDSQYIKDAVSYQVKEVVPVEVEKSTADIKQEVDSISSDLNWVQLTID